MADAQWKLISDTSSKSEVVRFGSAFHETTMRSDAEARVVAMAHAQWRKIDASRSVSEINQFLSECPELRAEAEQGVDDLQTDWSWVREHDPITPYQFFAARSPSHPERSWIERRIIDLEVAQIASSEHGELPRAEALSSGGTTADVEIENRTDYELTVRYSGPDSKKTVIPSGATRTVSLPLGECNVAAFVSASNMRDYYGSDSMHGGRYSSTFYIQSSFGGFSLPTDKPHRR